MKNILFVLASTVATTTMADIYISPQKADELAKNGTIKPLSVLESTAKSQVKGASIIYTNLEQDDDGARRYEYEAKVRDAQNTVWEITIDAQSGAVIEVDRDD